MRFFGIIALGILSNTALAETGICDRTPAVADFVVQTINAVRSVPKTCAEITAAELATVKRISVAGTGLTELKVGDFAGLPNLEILNIRSNEYTTLPEGLFAGLTNLKTLVIIDTTLRFYPDDFLKDTPNLENCHCFRNEVRSISLSVLERLRALPNLKILDFDDSLQDAEKTYLQTAFPVGGAVELNFY